VRLQQQASQNKPKTAITATPRGPFWRLDGQVTNPVHGLRTQNQRVPHTDRLQGTD
jgi:hypothetical protein